jgi:hypothetical protein
MAPTKRLTANTVAEAPMKGFDAWVGSHGAKRGPVERAANAAAAASDVSVAAQDSAVASDGRDADQGRDFLIVDGPTLRQFGDQHRRSDLANARNAFEDRLAAVGVNGERDRRVDAGELVLELGEIKAAIAGPACSRRFSFATTMSITWRRRVTRSPRAMRPASMCGIWAGRMTRPTCTITNASMRSVLARRPLARAKAHARLGLTTATGTPADCSARTILSS